MSNTLGWLLLLGVWGTLSAQSEVAIDEFFDRHLPAQSRLELTAPPPFKTSLITAYDLRTETRDFEAGRQEFSVRFNFGSPGLIRAQRGMAAQLTTAPAVRPEGEYCDAVERLYEDWLELYELTESIRLHDSLLLVAADRRRLADYSTAALLTRVDELYRLRTRRTNLAMDTLRLHQRAQSLQEYYELTEQPLSFSLPLPAEVAAALMQSTDADATARRTEQDYRLALLDREEALELAEGRQLLDFLQLQYRSNNRDEIREKFSVGLAFRIQDSGNRRLKLQELRLEREQLAQEYRFSTQARLIRQSVERRQLAYALDYYEGLAILIDTEVRDLRQLTELAARDASRSPDLLLDLRERTLDHRLRLLDAYLDVLTAYLDWRAARDERCPADRGQWLGGDR